MSPLLASGTVTGGYRIEGLLGRGGMGVVYEATQLSLGRTVALKLLAGDMGEDDSFRARFRREARIQAAIDHAHIVSIYEAGELDGEGLFIAMQLVRGPNLKQVIRDGELTPERTVRLLTPIADALDTAHEASLVHRDIKPQNMLVGRRDHAFLADFGLTRRGGDTNFTRTGVFVGTLDYAAPEQIEGATPTAASDLYSFGAVAFECLTGSVPFRGQSEAAVMLAHLNKAPPIASSLVEGLPAAVDEALVRALSKNPAERQDSVLTLMAELEEALEVAPARRVPQPAPPVIDPVRESTLPLDVPEQQTPAPDPAANGHTEIIERPPPAAETIVPDVAPSAPPTETITPEPEAVSAAPPAETVPPEPETPPAEPVVAEPAEASAPPADEDQGTEMLSRPGAATVADPRPGREPAAAAVPVARRRTPRISLRWLALALIPIAGLLGVLAAGGGEDPTTTGSTSPPPEPRQVEAEIASASVPGTWREADALAIPGLELAGASSAAPADAEDIGISVGTTSGTGPALLPPLFTKLLDEPPGPGEPVRLGEIEAYRHTGLQPKGLDEELTLYVAPTNRGVANVACVGDAVQSDCSASAATLILADGVKALPLGPSRAYARAVNGALGKLERQRGAAIGRLRRADLPGRQAGAASDVAAAYRRARAALRKARPTALEREAHPSLVAAVDRSAAAWAALASAARSESKSRYDAARSTVRARDADLRNRVNALAKLGYDVE